tara:strand:- start:18 stop:137 length:120 start_codon:yes stop_codon:yes gene_type:complete
MPRKTYAAEQIISKLREAWVHLPKGLKAPAASKKLGIAE